MPDDTLDPLRFQDPALLNLSTFLVKNDIGTLRSLLEKRNLKFPKPFVLRNSLTKSLLEKLFVLHKISKLHLLSMQTRRRRVCFLLFVLSVRS